jgi:hypothetical protein
VFEFLAVLAFFALLAAGVVVFAAIHARIRSLTEDARDPAEGNP